MKYENAKDILPASLLKEVQKYAEGKAIYIPKCEKTKGWGEASGYREKLNKRNALIQKFLWRRISCFAEKGKEERSLGFYFREPQGVQLLS